LSFLSDDTGKYEEVLGSDAEVESSRCGFSSKKEGVEGVLREKSSSNMEVFVDDGELQL
jgi:hypothetical protein